ncbi:MAG: Ig-like domain-containing protein [Pseudomonadota bacterium]
MCRVLALFVLFLITGASCKDNDSVVPHPSTSDSGAAGEAGEPGPVASLELTPRELSIAAGTSSDVQATLIASDGTNTDVTSDASWTSSDPEVVTVEGGTVVGLEVGTAEITVTASSLTATLTVTVTDATLLTLSITPPTPTLAKGLEKQLKATGVFTDNTTQDLTKQVTWSSATKKFATVSSQGLLTAVAVGSAKISAVLGATSANTLVTVSSAVVGSIALTPPEPSLPKGTTRELAATATLTDSTTQDVTSQAAWTSSDESIATVDAISGVVTGVAVGQATISASVDGVTGSTEVTVAAASLVSIDVTPATPSMPKGLTKQFTATGSYSDDTVLDLTSQVTWASSDDSMATISNATGSQGLASTTGVGSASISATLDGVSGSTTITVTAATLVSIGVTPTTPSVAKGLTRQFTATGTYTDATTQNLTMVATWLSSDTTKSTISNAAGSQGLASTAGVGLTVISATFGAVTNSTTLTVTAATLVSIGVTPATPSVAKGLTRQFSATGTYTDATTQDLTTTATWASSDTTKATISNAVGSQGLASSAGVGPTSISATLSSVTGSTTLTVSAATLVSIAVTPATPSIAKGLTRQFTATGTYTDATTQNVTTAATWASSDTETATISNAVGSQGLASTPKVGTASISATLNGVSNSTTFTVTAATLVSIGVTPATPSVTHGLTRQFTATGVYTDASTQNLTTTASWASSDTTKATISNAAGSQGVASGAGVGSTSISATLNGVSNSTTLTVTAATLVSIGVTPATPSIAKGLTQQFTAVGVYTDATTQDLTATATWASSDTGKATISNAVGSQGLASTPGVGSTSISATLDGVTGSTTLTVTAATLVSIGVTPATPSIAKGLTQQFTAMGTYTDASTQNLTTTATWSSSDTEKATISNAVGSQGLASTPGVGSTSISATLAGVTGSTTLAVTAATLVSIGVTPATPSVANGLTLQFTATGSYTDASTQNLTATATWASGDPTKASISNAAGSQGLASTAAVGSTSISATLGSVSGSTTLAVTAATLVSIGVTPAAPSIAKGLTQQFTAMGIYTDATTQNLTTTATWASSDTAKATISNAVGSQGLASTPGVGPTSISATLGSVTGSTTLTVSAATLVSLAVSPATPSVAQGLTRQFAATGTYTDASTQNLTATATWLSSDTTKATISNAAGSQGLASTAAVGSTSISATLNGVSDSTTLTVTVAALVSIAVTPATPSVAKGLTKQFAATGTFTDTTTQDLTTTATWASSDTTKATISNAAGSKGLASTPGVGPTSISATLSGVTGSTTLTVSAATLVSIAVTPVAPPLVAKGLTQQFTATGSYTDASTQNLTTTATWISSDITKATISNAAGSQGLASTTGVGSTSISATLNGVSDSTTLMVGVATLVSVAVTPASPGLPINTTLQFALVGTYTDASTQDLTTSSTWASSNTAAATISNVAGSIALATAGPTVGLSTTISATFGALVGSTTAYIGRHDIVAWTGFSTYTFSCNMNGSTGIPLGNFEWLTMPNLTWKACLLQASMRGAQVLSPANGPWPLPGWFASRAATGVQVMTGGWTTYTSDSLSNTHNCNLVRDRQSGATNNAPLTGLVTYDGDVWRYQDFGVMYVDQCEKLASAAGASIITPWTIGLLNGDNYWHGVLHTCSVYSWSAANGAGFAFDNTIARLSQKGCMLGYIL